MTDEETLAAVREEAGACPRCNAMAAKPLFWGYPTVGTYARFGDRVGWGGCCIPEQPAAYVCDSCGQEYGVARTGGPAWDDEIL